MESVSFELRVEQVRSASGLVRDLLSKCESESDATGSALADGLRSISGLRGDAGGGEREW